MNEANNTESSMPDSSSSGSRLNSIAGVSASSSGQGGSTFRADSLPTATMTITETSTSSNQNYEVLQLTLRPNPSVRWDEEVVDNEGLGRKSSKRCCIFHKQREFGESSTDSSDEEGNRDSDGSSSSGGPTGNNKPIARKKLGETKSKKLPDYQRFHA